jgi:hypothetical protein
VHDEQRDKQETRAERDKRDGTTEAAAHPDFGEPVDENGDAARQEREAADIESRVGSRQGVWKQPQRQRQGERADRQVDEEDPAPAGGVDDRAADDGAEDRREEHRDADQAHDPAHPLGPRGLREHRLAERKNHPGAQTLHDAERDQRRDRP